MKRLIYYISILFVFVPYVSRSQDYALMVQFNEIQDYSLKNNHVNQLIENGHVYENVYMRDLGHPFYQDDEVVRGEVVFNHTVYSDLALKYNIFDQTLFLRPDINKFKVDIILPTGLISEFALGNTVFKKYAFFERDPTFYQLVAETSDLKSLYHWKKSRETSSHIPGIVSYKFSKAKVHKFLVLKGEVLTYKGNLSFVRLFPHEVQEGLAGFLKTNHIKMRQITDSDMSDLLHFCQGQLEKLIHQ